ncbi:MAG TPA: hypothetical protein VE781_11330 [Kineosporiaceae bacterium]|nr:hypothetical protein [Kineosporiaceae bacterium]
MRSRRPRLRALLLLALLSGCLSLVPAVIAWVALGGFRRQAEPPASGTGEWGLLRGVDGAVEGTFAALLALVGGAGAVALLVVGVTLAGRLARRARPGEPDDAHADRSA